MDVLAIVAAALGGGVVASLLEAWMNSLRAFETARLLVMHELITNVAISETARQFPNRHWQTVYAASAWQTQRAVLSTRLSRRAANTFRNLSSFYGLLEGMPPGNEPIPEATERIGRETAEALKGLTLPRVSRAVVYFM